MHVRTAGKSLHMAKNEPRIQIDDPNSDIVLSPRSRPWSAPRSANAKSTLKTRIQFGSRRLSLPGSRKTLMNASLNSMPANDERAMLTHAQPSVNPKIEFSVEHENTEQEEITNSENHWMKKLSQDNEQVNNVFFLKKILNYIECFQYNCVCL